jgi:chromosome segregation ATPase
MKKASILAAIALVFAACSNIAEFKPMIEALSAQWDSTTGSVTDFANTVKSEQANLAAATQAAAVSPEVMAKWSDQLKNQYTELQNAYVASESGLAGIAAELDAFVAEWDTKSSEVKALTDGLAAGKLEDNVKEKIAELTAAANDATSKLEGWKSNFEQAKSTAAQSLQAMTEFLAANSPAAATAPAGKK